MRPNNIVSVPLKAVLVITSHTDNTEATHDRKKGEMLLRVDYSETV